MPRWRGMTIVVTIVVAGLFILDTPARAESHISPDGPATAELSVGGPPAGQNAAPSTGSPPFLPPAFNPSNGSTVGVAKPIIINFQRPITNRPLAEQAIHISSTPAVPGKYYWMTDSSCGGGPSTSGPRTPPSPSMPPARNRPSARAIP